MHTIGEPKSDDSTRMNTLTPMCPCASFASLLPPHFPTDEAQATYLRRNCNTLLPQCSSSQVILLLLRCLFPVFPSLHSH